MTDVDKFSLDHSKVDVWLTAKLEDAGLAPDAHLPSVTVGELAVELLHKAVDNWLYELHEAAALHDPDGLTVSSYPIDVDDDWTYLLTVRSAGGRFVQVAGLSDDVHSDTPVIEFLNGIVDDANWLVPAARAAATALTERIVPE